MTLSHETIFVGIDVGKFDCVLSVFGQPRTHNFEMTPEGLLAILAHLHGLPGEVRIGVEATGGYEAPLWEACHSAGLHIRRAGSQFCQSPWKSGQDRPD